MNPVTGLAIGRIAIGFGALVAPEATAKLFQLDVARNPQLPYMTRMFGSREVAIGAMTLLARGRARRRMIALGIAIDGADAYAGVSAIGSGSVTKPVGAFLTVPAIGGVLAGVSGLLGSEQAASR